MDEYLLTQWNNCVGESDTVYILGDLFFRNAVPADEYLSGLHGKKHLIKGNHDKDWMKKADLDKHFASISSKGVTIFVTPLLSSFMGLLTGLVIRRGAVLCYRRLKLDIYDIACRFRQTGLWRIYFFRARIISTHNPDLVACEMVAGIATVVPTFLPSSLTQPKPSIHMDLTPSIMAIVPGLGSVADGLDGEIGFGDGFIDWDTSGLWAVSGADKIIGSVSVIGSNTKALFSTEIASVGVSSDSVSIPAVTAVFSGSAGKSTISAL